MRSPRDRRLAYRRARRIERRAVLRALPRLIVLAEDLRRAFAELASMRAEAGIRPGLSWILDDDGNLLPWTSDEPEAQQGARPPSGDEPLESRALWEG